ncbi:MAG TPA: sigma-54-dependent Fis family transcriptional regulator [Blastocatellia bacterium]|nr:sigma-54-dependent Fis family transcriptional regulator [Blastocatellia bacterium]
MKTRISRIKNLSSNFGALLDREQRACRAQVAALVESIKTIQGSSGDVRLRRLVAQLKSLQERLVVLSSMGRDDFLAKIDREAEALSLDLADGRASKIMTALMNGPPLSLNQFCERLLDLLNQAMGAERGFILFYLPESSEADVVAARNFQTKNLSLEEYDFSRTLLREVFKREQSLLLEDASQDPTYSKENSVIKFQLKSVLVTPLKGNGHAIGAIYLENNTHPCAFDVEDPQLVESVARFAVFYLHHVGLLSAAFEQDSRIFLDASKASKEIIGEDPKILALQSLIARIADSPATVLIEGESGTGKELVARALHYQSARRDHPFVAINCAAIPDNLLESELFGYEKGAFTGATERHIGRIEQGDCGTIFLDEVSELAYGLQAKLLRFLQSNEFSRLGGRETIRVDVRIVAATSKDLQAMMQEGKFQEALYYRLNVIPARLPSLVERKDDIPILAVHFLKKFIAIYGKPIRLEAQALELLKEHSFRGNVRELENLIHRMVALASTEVIRIGDLPPEILQTRAARISLQTDSVGGILDGPVADFEELRLRKKRIRGVLAEQERALIERTVQDAGGNLTEAASRLGIHRITLHKMLRRAKEPSR